MEFTIKTTHEDNARMMMAGPSYFSFITEFWEWLNGPGRAPNLEEIRAKFHQLSCIHCFYLP